MTAPPPLIQAFSGALGSAVGNAIVFPLDLATARAQHSAKKVSVLKTLLQIVRRHGYARLYSGLAADTLSTFLSTFLYFLIFISLKRAFRWRQEGDAAKASSDVLFGTIAGVASKRLILPISAVCIRQQLGEKPESIQETLRKMRKDGGIAGLFHIPLSASLLALLPSLTLFFNDQIVKRLPHSKLSSSAIFTIAAASNVLATLPLYPLMLVKAQGLSGHARNRSFLGPFMDVINKQGVPGLYRGIEAQLLKGFVEQGVMMLVKQRLEDFVLRYHKLHPAL